MIKLKPPEKDSGGFFMRFGLKPMDFYLFFNGLKPVPNELYLAENIDSFTINKTTHPVCHSVGISMLFKKTVFRFLPTE
ncbi:hypothetical protein [Chryseobacterium cucumeris]|uniref:hypothetical protein n=1 Tax=Chryseobacterium cucumeris TaxID=1813611 RepID=UPI003D9918AC